MVYHIDTNSNSQSQQSCNVDKYGEPILSLLKCGHMFHFECIWKWIQSHTKCPICRSHTSMDQKDIKAVSLFAVFPQLDARNKAIDTKSDVRNNIKNTKNVQLPEVRQSATANKEIAANA